MGHHVIITGASSGMGAALAETFAAQGYSVGLIARRADRLQQVAEKVWATGGVAAVAVGDVVDPASLRAAISSLEAELGPCEVMVANAGIGYASPIDPVDLPGTRRMLEVNLYGAVYTFGAVLPGMVARKRGTLVAISSLASYRGLPGQAAYCATKAGLSALATSLRSDLRRTGVKVLDVYPGYFISEIRGGKVDESKLPMVLSAEDAARRVVAAVRNHREQIAFPLLMHWLALLGRLLPAPLFDRIALSMVPRK